MHGKDNKGPDPYNEELARRGGTISLCGVLGAGSRVGTAGIMSWIEMT